MPNDSGSSNFVISPKRLADHAVAALLEELNLHPKPGLVSPMDSGSHKDMDYDLMKSSAISLHSPFCDLARLGAGGASFESQLIPSGLRAECQMMQITGGINTHRGAIFCMGLLVAASASLRSAADPPTAIRHAIRNRWGASLEAHSRMGIRNIRHGSAARRNSGAGGAREEAAGIFPSIFEVALPCYTALLTAGTPRREAGIQTLFLLMSSVPDTNTLHRGGKAGSAHVMESARDFLNSGGITNPAWEEHAEQIHADFVAKNLSPGGSADLLAGTFFVDRVTREIAGSPTPATTTVPAPFHGRRGDKS
jgi:triphosphoribosyl-dephospho-CoA synthase